MDYKFKIYQNESRRRNGMPLIVNTEVSIDNNTMLVNCNKKNGIFNRRYGSYNWGYRKINISDIESIQTKNGYLYGYWHIISFFMVGFSLLASIGIIFLSVFPLIEKYVYNVDRHIYINGTGFIAIPLAILILLGWISSFTFRSLRVNVKGEEPIIFPYRKFWSIQRGSINSKYKDTENIKEFERLIKELKAYNIDVQIKRPKIDVKFLKIFLFISVIMVIIGLLPWNMIERYFESKKIQREKIVQEEQEKVEKNNVISAIQNNECYVNVEFKKGQLIKRKNDFNVYKIVGTNEEIEIKEQPSVIDGIFKIGIFKFYSKNNDEIISTEYNTSMIADPNNANNDWMTITKYNVHYIYNFSTQKLISFNIPNADLSKLYVSKPFKIGFYYKNKNKSNNSSIGEINQNSVDEIYEFLVSNNMEQENVGTNYTYLKRIGQYKSEYGWCFIIKGNTKSSEKDLYFMCIHNNEMVSPYDINGIVLSYTNGDDEVIDESTAIEYFKKIVPEM